MTKEPTHRIQIEVPKSWLPELAAITEAEQRSRHNVILRLIRQGLDLRVASEDIQRSVRNKDALQVRTTEMFRGSDGTCQPV